MNITIANITKIIFILMIGSGCLLNQPKKREAGACNNNQYFDPATRSCMAASNTPMPPRNTLKSVDIFEDTTQQIELTYTDPNNDLAIGCNISSLASTITQMSPCACMGGVCTVDLRLSANYYGLSQFYYSIIDQDGSSNSTLVRVNGIEIDDAPIGIGTIPISGTTFSQDFSQEYILLYSDQEADLASACELTLSSNDIYISRPCNCDISGYCSVEITGTPAKYTSSTQAFTYSIYANGQWSDPTIITYNILNVNDLPVPQNLIAQGTVSEDFTSMIFNIYYDEADDSKPADCGVVVANSPSVIETSCDCSTPNFGQCELTVNVSTSYANLNKDTPQEFSLVYELQDAEDNTWVSSSSFSFTVEPINDDPVISGDGGVYTGDENTSFLISPSALTIDEGGGIDENAQTLEIKVTSSDINIIPNENIEIYWGTTLITNNYGDWSALGDSTTSADANNLSFRIRPTQDLTGTVVLTIDVRDSLLATATGQISVTVVDVNDAPKMKVIESLCLSKITSKIDNPSCTDKGCVYNDDPIAKGITPVNYGEVYFDFKSKLCYFSDSATTWKIFRTSCDFSSSKNETGCLDLPNEPKNCIGNGTPIDVITPAKSGSYYYDYTNDVCYKSTGTSSNDNWSIVELYNDSPTCNSSLSDTFNPLENVTPTAIKTIFRNTQNNSCWISTGTTISDWLAFSCPITSGAQSGNIPPRGNTDPNDDLSASAKDEFYFDYNTSICYKSLAAGTTNWVIYGGELKDLEGNESAPLGNSKSTANIFLTDLRITEGTLAEAATQGVEITIENLTRSQGTPFIGNEYLLPLNRNTLELYQSDSSTGNKTNITLNTIDTDEKVSFILANDAGSLRNEPIEMRFHTTAAQYGRSELKITLTDTNVTPVKTKSYYFSVIIYPVRGTHQGWTQLQSIGDKKNITGTTIKNRYVYLKWDKMQVFGAVDQQLPMADPDRANGDYTPVSITGYNIYRRMANTPFDYTMPLNGTTLIPTTTLEFTDNLTNTAITPGAPDESTVYYYTIAGVDSFNNKLIHTGDKFNTIRIVVPPKNMAFVHRWFMNREICKKMNKTTSQIDALNNYRCLYSGPGENGSYYDIGADLLVDQFEAGCPYTSIGQTGYSQCSSWGCIDTQTSAPTGVTTSNLVYYSRGDGTCSFYNGANWISFGNIMLSTLAENTQYPLLPPLTNILQEDALAVCELRADVNITKSLGSTTTLTNGYSLPTRKQQIAYSAWNSNLSDEDILNVEIGAALNASSKCNSYNANGLNGHSDDPIPSFTNLYSLPGSTSSNIRSIRTGDPLTKSCISAYGIQDLVGNVKEWVQDRLMCHPTYSPTATNNVISNTCESAYSAASYNGLFCPVTSSSYIQPGAPATTITGTVSPGSVYLDTTLNKCWVYIDGTTQWNNISSYCPVTSSTVETGCGTSNLTCVGTDHTTITPTRTGSFYWDYDDNICYESIGTATGQWQAVPALSVPTALNTNNDNFVVDNYFDHWITDGWRSNCWDSNSDGFCDDSPIDSWIISDETFNAGLWTFPLGLPVQRNFKSDFPLSTINDHLLELSTKAGISSQALHQDTISIKSSEIVQASGNANCGAMSTGGGYESASGAGRYNFEVSACNTGRVDTGFRCSIQIDESSYDE